MENYDEYTNEIDDINFEYINEKGLGLYDFINSIIKDLIKNISKNRCFIDENINNFFEFIVNFINDENGENKINFYVDIEEFDNGNLHTCKFIEDVVKFVIDFDGFIDDDSIIAYGFRTEEFKCDINDYIDSFEVNLYVNGDKLSHKSKFYNDLYDGIMAAAWHPSRYLDWCVDIEELKFLKELWGED